jgi:hypothetical protein
MIMPRPTRVQRRLNLDFIQDEVHLSGQPATLSGAVELN